MTLRRVGMKWVTMTKPKNLKYYVEFWKDSNAIYWYNPVDDEFYRVILQPHELWHRAEQGLGR